MKIIDGLISRWSGASIQSGIYGTEIVFQKKKKYNRLRLIHMPLEEETNDHLDELRRQFILKNKRRRKTKSEVSTRSKGSDVFKPPLLEACNDLNGGYLTFAM